jgi:hypothetical protein
LLALDEAVSPSVIRIRIERLRAKQLTDNPNTIAVQDANLKIQAKIRVNQDGTWNIFNPHVFAQGWI